MNETMDKTGVLLDWDTADRITLCTLTEYRKRLKEELDAYDNGEYLHKDDVDGNHRRIVYLNLIIKDFGGE